MLVLALLALRRLLLLATYYSATSSTLNPPSPHLLSSAYSRPRRNVPRSAASTSSFAAPSMAKMTDEQLREMDYLNQIRSLDMLLSESKERLSQMKVLASQVKKMELDDPDLAKLGDDDKGLKKALAAARAAADVHGPDSSEARVAWESLEACADELGECPVDGGAPDPTRYSAAALKAHHYYDAVVDSKLLQDAVDAFGAIERLGDYVRLERKRLDGK